MHVRWEGTFVELGAQGGHWALQVEQLTLWYFTQVIYTCLPIKEERTFVSAFVRECRALGVGWRCREHCALAPLNSDRGTQPHCSDPKSPGTQTSPLVHLED